MKIRYYGHACFLLITEDNTKIIIDPWITNPLSPINGADEISEKIDYILITHDHSDHFGEALEVQENHRAQIIGVFEIVKDLENSIPLNIGGRIKLSENTEVIATPAYHSSFKGCPVGYIINFGNKTIYHAGDTDIFMEMKILGELYDIDVALLPIGGTFTMDTITVVKALELIQPKKFIPMHYNTFEVIKVSKDQLEDMTKNIERLGIETIILEPGEEIEI